jgi:tripartite-type tricarboxylate transporter receptor subunit TctC
MNRTACLFLIPVLWMLQAAAFAQGAYPSPSVPVKLVLGVPPGGTPDFVARLIAQKMAAQMNASVVVDNKPGANGNIGAEFVAKSKPDGYTLLLDTNQTVLSRAFDQKLGYDVFKDLAPVGFIASSPFVLAVNSAVPVNNVAEFVAYLKTNPGKLAFGSGGVGAMSHFGPILFLQAFGVSALHVPFKGAGPALLDLAAGRVQFTMQGPTVVVPLAKDKRVKMIAITSLTRSPLLPDLPTLAESGMPGFELVT